MYNMHSIMWQAALHIQGNPQLEKQRTCNQKMQTHATTKYTCKKKQTSLQKTCKQTCNKNARLPEVAFVPHILCIQASGVRSELQTFKKLPKPKENAKKGTKREKHAKQKRNKCNKKNRSCIFACLFSVFCIFLGQGFCACTFWVHLFCCFFWGGGGWGGSV